MSDSEGDAHQTALFDAVKNQNESCVRALIAARANVHIRDNEGKTALFYAVLNDDITIAKALVEKRARLNEIDKYGRSPLFYAITKSQTLFEYLAGQEHVNLNLKDKRQLSILSYFIEICTCTLSSEMENRISVMKKKISLENDYIFETMINFVLCKLLQFGSKSKVICEVLEISKTYTGHEQNKKAINKILDLLKQESHLNSQVPEVLRLLLEMGANPNATDIKGNTPLHYATRLPFWGVPRETVKSVFTKLEESFSLKILHNHNDESPLLFSLSQDTWTIAGENEQWAQLSIFLDVVWKFLLNNEFRLTDTTREHQESAFHLILNLFHRLTSNGMKKEFTDIALKLLNKLLSKRRDSKERKEAMNRTDYLNNSPLHYWAKLEPASSVEQHNSTPQGLVDFKELSKQIFDIFKDNKAKLNQKNDDDETPLHVSKTWHAAELLLKPENAKCLDSCGRSPLIVAARSRKWLQPYCHFYPDVSDAESFWDTALSKRLDLWIVDQNGESIMSILIEHQHFSLAESLLEFAIRKGYLDQDEIASNLLNAICKDASIHATEKIDYVKKILKERNTKLTVVDNHLRICCENIMSELCRSAKATGNTDTKYSPPAKKAKTVDSKDIKETVHWKIAEQLLSYGANPTDCLGLTKTCPALKPLLTVDIKTITPAIRNFKAVSSKHQDKLFKLNKRQEMKAIGNSGYWWYHTDPLNNRNSGAHVFVGLNTKDRREVAYKRVQNHQLHHPLEEEIRTLVRLTECNQVVRYIDTLKDDTFSYIVLELMEGNLAECLREKSFDRNINIKLFNDLLLGLKYMHTKDILHRSINPKNILYKVVDGIFLFKFANFNSSNSDKFWVAPELSQGASHSKKTDIFSLGRVFLHCLLNLSKKSKGTSHDVATNTNNIDNFNTWANPEASHLLGQMVQEDPSKRITAEDAQGHPWLWSQKKKREFLCAAGGQPEFKNSSLPRNNPRRSSVLNELDDKLSHVIDRTKYRKWDDLHLYCRIAIIKENMEKKYYDTTSVAALVHFSRNVITHFRDLPKHMQDWVLKDNEIQESYPKLIIVVLQVIKDPKYRWDREIKEIEEVLKQE